MAFEAGAHILLRQSRKKLAAVNAFLRALTLGNLGIPRLGREGFFETVQPHKTRGEWLGARRY